MKMKMFCLIFLLIFSTAVFGQEDTAVLNIKADQSKSLISKSHGPVAKLAGKSGSFSLTKSEILKNLILTVDSGYNIIYFEMAATVGAYEIVKSTHCALFTAEMLYLVRKLEAGQKLYLGNITAKSPDGITRKLSPIIITVK
ncbi:MAG: hypothetical protein H0X62_02860 [Bacteroidetes bacterium]|nr:hypothetical protein [Bacteroidota bacterium]